ncbi:MAG: hypothetical protein ACFFEJ_05910 [Candidatus Thorarchaeota archaeon]
MLQTELTLIDIGTVISIASVAIAILGMIVAWISESRNNRRKTAMDAIANRLLPFYSLVLEGLSKINLFMMMYKSIQYKDLGLDSQEFHQKAGEAFVYMRDINSRQLVINTIQILDAIQLVQDKTTSERIAITISKILPLLGLIKNHIEVYLDKYSDALDVPSPDLNTLNEIADSHAEAALLEVIQIGADEKEQ